MVTNCPGHERIFQSFAGFYVAEFHLSFILSSIIVNNHYPTPPSHYTLCFCYISCTSQSIIHCSSPLVTNMHVQSLLSVVLLVGSAAAKTCINATVSVDISARTGVFNIAVPQTNLDGTTFSQNITQQGRNFTETALTGYATTAGTYEMSTQFCMPSEDMPANPTVQVLTHGIGFDKT